MISNDHREQSTLFYPATAPVWGCRWGDKMEPPHTHDFIEVKICICGSIEHHSADGIYKLEKGDCVILSPGNWHSCHNAQNFDGWVLAISRNAMINQLSWSINIPELNHALWRINESSQLVRMNIRDESLTELGLQMQAITELIISKKESIDYACTMLLGRTITILSILIDNIKLQANNDFLKVHPALLKVIKKIDKEPFQTWSVQTLAGTANLEASYLTRIFKNVLGIPPMQYIQRIRLQYATDMLTSGNQKIASIASECGWKDPVVFGRRFKKVYKITPGEYRKKFSKG